MKTICGFCNRMLGRRQRPHYPMKHAPNVALCADCAETWDRIKDDVWYVGPPKRDTSAFGFGTLSGDFGKSELRRLRVPLREHCR